MTAKRLTKPSRRHWGRSLQTARIQSLMAFLGMPKEAIYIHKNGPYQMANHRRQSFWQRNEAKLHFLLHDTHRLYRQAMKDHHPDRRGSERHAASLSQAWQRAKKLFAQKGIKL